MLDDCRHLARRNINDFDGPAFDPAMATGSTADSHAIARQALIRKIVVC
jgi:hypothetical protein